MNVINPSVVITSLALSLSVSNALAAKNEAQSSSSSNETYAQLHTASNSGFYTLSNPIQLLDRPSGESWHSGDFNGDGLDDLIAVYRGRVLIYPIPPDQALVFKEYVSKTYFGNGNGFEANPRKQTLNPGWRNTNTRTWSNERVLVGDFNGDGKDDLASIYAGEKLEDGRRAVVKVRISSETGL